jgi:hypothetical protein
VNQQIFALASARRTAKAEIDVLSSTLPIPFASFSLLPPCEISEFSWKFSLVVMITSFNKKMFPFYFSSSKPVIFYDVKVPCQISGTFLLMGVAGDDYLVAWEAEKPKSK